MTAYIIFDIDVTDPAGYEDYRHLASAASEQHDVTYLARGGRAETLEGDWDPKRVVVLQFPDAAAARGWYNSPGYRRAREVRQRTARTRAILVEGV